MNTFRRIQALRSHMARYELDACLLSSPENIQYMSGFQAITYSRPIFFLVNHTSACLIIPALEEEHADLTSTGVEQLRVYYEHPEKVSVAGSPLDHLKQLLSRGTRLGVEFSAITLRMADTLRALGCQLSDLSDTLKSMRYVKDSQELDCIREGGRLCRYAFEKTLEHARAGVSEMELEQYGTQALYELLGDDYPYSFSSPSCITPSGVERTIMPHVYSSCRRLARGDMVIHVRKPAINGYYAELERTFFIGRPADPAKRAFCAMVEAQLAVFERVRPGVPAADLDRAGRDVLRKYGYGDYAIHRIGHGQGLGRHEEPYLSCQTDMVLQENMVFTVEPGIYIPGVGGFRHSDTIIVTKTGFENVTAFPRTLDELTFDR